MLHRRKRVLVLDESDAWQGTIPILDLSEQEGEAVFTKTVTEASPFFNGVAGAELLIVGNVSGIADFVKDIRGRFGELHIIGLAEHREELSNLGCNCFVARDVIPYVVKCRLHY
ncbi:MAG: hypothetical protein Q7S86_03270 [bacterium]|nr:hypothetical protein [bacterium]